MRPQRQGRCVPAMLVAVLLGGALVARAAGPAEYEDFSELDLESLLDQTIVTASKHEQKLSDTPAAATVITAEEIAASGARTVAEVLRRVPGLDVIQTTASGYDASTRGLNQPGSNAMLTLVDGRSVYMDFYGLTVWDHLAVSIEDIKAIEVIMGPGSAMYGANAFAGVINIITFTADEKPGNTARAMASNLGEGYGSLRHADARGEVSWKLTTSWDRAENWEERSLQSDNVRLDGQIRYDLAPDSWLTVGGGHVNGFTELVASNAPMRADGRVAYARADYVRGDLEVRWYTNNYDAVAEPRFPEITAADSRVESRMHDVEFQHSFRPGAEHFLLWGGSYRHRSTDNSRQDGDYLEDIYAGFVLEEWSPGDALTVSAGLRYEHHPLVGGHVSPRGGLVYKPHQDHALRFSYGKAYRDPTYLETQWRAEVTLAPELVQVIRGDAGLCSEEIQALELGYQGLIADDLLITAALFANDIDHLIALETVATFPVPPAPMPGIPSEYAFANKESWNALGGELSFQSDPASWLRLSGHYAHVRLEDSATGARVERAPVHTARLDAVLRPSPRHRLRLGGRYRSETVWQSATVDDVSEERLLLDAGWNLDLSGGHHVTLAVQNLLDRRVRDHPLAIEQRRRILTSVTVEF